LLESYCSQYRHIWERDIRLRKLLRSDSS